MRSNKDGEEAIIAKWGRLWRHDRIEIIRMGGADAHCPQMQISIRFVIRCQGDFDNH
jgi:hypothetical protein